MRTLFAFDPWRTSILLVAADKTDRWNASYDEAIPLAEQRYETYLKARADQHEGRSVMRGHVCWCDVRAEQVARAGGEQAVDTAKDGLLAELIGHRLAEVRRARRLTQQQVADRMGVTKGRVSQIEQGTVSGHEVVARFATALGGRLHQAIYFDDADIAALA
jgi:DNA-binding XRE family transcriptional regulator